MMAWTRRQLDEAVTEYQRVLSEAQQAPGSIRTAVGDARLSCVGSTASLTLALARILEF
jgi:hypothetical protein